MSAWGRGGAGNGRGRGGQNGRGRRDPMAEANGAHPREQFPALGNLGGALPPVAAQAGGAGTGGGQGRGRGVEPVAGQDHGRGANGGGRRGARRVQRVLPPLDERYDFVPSRPKDANNKDLSKKGSAGKAIGLVSNYFPVTSKTTWNLYNYRVDFAPEDLETHQKKGMVRKMKEHEKELGSFVFDGTNMYTAQRLSQPKELYAERNGQNYKITFTLTSEIPPGDVVCIQFFNIILRTCLQTLGLEEIRRRFYDPVAAIQTGLNITLWPGFITTIREHENGLMMCVEVTHKVLRMESALQAIRNHGPNGRQLAREELVGSVVINLFNRKTYTVADIDWDRNPRTTFPLRNGTQTSFVDYFRTKHQQQIQDLQQPLLIAQPTSRDYHRYGEDPPEVCLVPELCNMTGLSDTMRSNVHTMRELATHLQLPPQARVTRITKLMDRIRSNTEAQVQLKNWNLQFNSALVTLEGRVLTDDIQMRKNGAKCPLKMMPNADWTNDLRDKQMYSSTRLDKWVVIVPQRDANGVPGLISKMRQAGAANKLDFAVADPLRVYPIPDVRINSYTSAIQAAVAEATKRGVRLDLVFVIIHKQDVDLYKAIKRTCYISTATFPGVSCQCFQGKHLNSPDSRLFSVVTKVVVQMCAKLGGEPWVTSNPMASMNTMVVGFDVYHSGKGQARKSVGAFVATTNKDLSTYYSSVCSHSNREELSTVMVTHIQKCTMGYRARNGSLPGVIMFYRDGVGEGQLHYVVNIELPQIEAGLAAIYGDGAVRPKLVFIVVTKKGNSRIFLNNVERIKGNANPPPGTIVDNTITLPERFDFYLISQESRQGTVSPTAYNVIRNECTKLDPDKLQRFTYKLCHLYYNWSGTVAVPAVCQYAHKLAYLTGQYLEEPASESLAHFLYFL